MSESSQPDPVQNSLIQSALGNQGLIFKIMGYVNTFNTIRAYIMQARAWWKNKHTYKVIVHQDNRLFWPVADWMSTLLVDDSQHISMESIDGKVKVRTSADLTQKINVKGHEVEVVYTRPRRGMEALREELGEDSSPGTPRSPSHPVGFTFTCFSREAQAAVAEEIERVGSPNENGRRIPRLNLMSDWYSNTSNVLPMRDIETVVLEEGQVERLVTTIQNFLNGEKEYNRRGIPWHLGILLYGPPGTGKTSVAKALASHFGLDLNYIPLGSVSGDDSLTKMIARVEVGQILLLEDVDVFSGMTTRSDTEQKRTFTLSGLLNVLDGVMTPHGLITIMTTNDKSQLDPAVLRPGRVDLQEKLDYLVKGQADRIFEVFYGQPPKSPIEIIGVPPSRLMGVFREHMYDPDTAEEILHDTNITELPEFEDPTFVVPQSAEADAEDSDGVQLAVANIRSAITSGSTSSSVRTAAQA